MFISRTITVGRLHPGQPKDFQPIKNHSCNRELGGRPQRGPTYFSLVTLHPKFFTVKNGLILAQTNQRPKILIFFLIMKFKCLPVNMHCVCEIKGLEVEIMSVQFRINQSRGRYIGQSQYLIAQEI